jgi:hypothetical protein
MIANPFICSFGPKLGEIRWLTHEQTCGGASEFELGNHEGFNRWKEYADFEREKLQELRSIGPIYLDNEVCYKVFLHTNDSGGPVYSSGPLIGYKAGHWYDDSESNRLLKRAEFLKAVCEKEGVEWLQTSDGSKEDNRCGKCRTDGQAESICQPKKAERCTYCRTILCGSNYEGRDCKCHCHKKNCPLEVEPEELVLHPGCDCQLRRTNEDIQHCTKCGKKWLPERDYYTKAEVEAKLKVQDERIDTLQKTMLTFVEDVWKHMGMIHKKSLGMED